MKKKNKTLSIHTQSNLPLITIGSVLFLIIALIVLIFFVNANLQNKTVLYTPPLLVASPTAMYIPNVISDQVTGWKIYTSKSAKLSIEFPPDWIVQQNENDSLKSHQDSVQLMYATSPLDQDRRYGIGIIYPITIAPPHSDLGKLYEHGLQGLAEKDSTESDSHFASKSFKYFTINGYNALETTKVWNSKPPANFGGSWCDNCTSRTVYIDLANGTILTLNGYVNPTFQTLNQVFDQSIKTFKVLQ